jgi:predicted Zn-dependent protease with MMP-like domain
MRKSIRESEAFMITIDEMETMIEEIVESLPEELFDRLNGGVILLLEEKENKNSKNNDLFILGEYHSGGVMGRYIAIYYGSFMRLYGNLKNKKIRKKIEHTIKHEFTHHLESLAGEKDLEIEDARKMKKYLSKYKK